jgi:hypothetical protein
LKILLLGAMIVAIPFGVRLVVQDQGPQPSNSPPVLPTSVAGLGDEVRDGGLTFVAESLLCPSDSGQPALDPFDNQGCVLTLTGRNHTSSPALFGPFQYVIDDAGRRYAPEEEVFQLSYLALNPDEEGTLALVFFVPPEARIEQLEVHGYPDSLGALIEVAPTS